MFGTFLSQTRHIFNRNGIFLVKVISFSFINVLKTGPIIEPKKLSIHGSLVRPVIESRYNRQSNKYIIYIFKYIINLI